MPRLPCRLVAAAALLAAPITTAAAQRTDSASTPRYEQTLSVNPIALPFGLFSTEYERVVSSGLTIGIGGSYLVHDAVDEDEFAAEDGRDAWGEVKALYYPGEVPLRGFAVGLTVGYHSARDVRSEPSFDDASGRYVDGNVRETTEGAATFGVLLDYNWLIGRRKRFLVGTGIGARRVLKDVDSSSPLAQVYPDGRLQIGLAF